MVFVLVLLYRKLFVFFFFMTWFAVFMQFKYPILRIFGEDRVRWVSEVSEDFAEPFLHGYPEVRKLRNTFWFYPS